jgi:predicted porin
LGNSEYLLNQAEENTMNKKLISMAVGAALAAGTVVAQAADDDAMPKVYGKIHVSYGAVKDEFSATGDPTFTDTDNIQFRSHASRIGVKGAVPISDSLKGTYGLEWGIDVGGSGTFSNRNQYAGLKGGFGEFRFGRHDTPTKMAQGKFDEFNDTDADIVGALKMSRGDLRLNNVLAYLSPDFSGFTFAAAIAPGEGNGCKATDPDLATCTENLGGSTGGDGPADILSIAGTYKMAGLMVSLGYDKYDDKAAGGDVLVFDADPDVEAYLDSPKAGGDYKSLMRLVATYKMDMFGVGALYETSSGNSDNYGEDKDVMGISGHVSLAGGHKIKLQYMTSSQDISGLDTAGGDKITPADNEETQISLGYDFKMGKATTAYAMYTQANDKINVKADFGGDTLERKYSFIGVGMIQNF